MVTEWVQAVCKGFLLDLIDKSYLLNQHQLLIKNSELQIMTVLT